jgi:hypothetical protein
MHGVTGVSIIKHFVQKVQGVNFQDKSIVFLAELRGLIDNKKIIERKFLDKYIMHVCNEIKENQIIG